MTASTRAGGVRTSRRHEEAILYAVAAVVYAALGLRYTTLVLNWIVGPLFPVLVIWLVPHLGRRRSRR